MARHQIVGLLLGLCAGAGCGSTEHNGAEAETDSTTKGTSSQTANTSTATQAASTTATTSVTATTSSSATTASANGNGSGSGGAGTGGTSATAGDTTGVGGGAGDANATDEACPSEAPPEFDACPRVDQRCYYEDCAGVGRTIATCLYGTWSLTTTPCSETVYCSAGGGQCSDGEICMIRAGGAFLQECLPNTCDTGPVECDCIEGCYGDCATYGSPSTGFTITCNTCPSGMACP